MNGHPFSLAGVALTALPSGALWHAAERVLAVSDLHFGKADRIARRAGTMLPPYETAETLDRLEADVARTAPATVICLGDSFDDLDAAASLTEEERLRLVRLQAGRRWIWIEGNHDPGPVDLGGTHLRQLRLGPLVFRHAAGPDPAPDPEAEGEVSGHFHPKHGLPGGGQRPAFLLGHGRLILPAYGTYTGGLRADSATLRALMPPPALAILTGRRAIPVPLLAPGPLSPARGSRPGRHWGGRSG